MSNETTKKNVRLVAGPVRFSFANVFEAKLNEQSGKKAYSCAFLIPKKNTELVAKVKAAIEEAKEIGKATKWKGKIPTKYKGPIKDGDELREEWENDGKPDRPEYKGMYVLNSTNVNKPLVFNKDREEITNEEDFYSGCYGHFIVDLFPYDNVGVGVSASLQGVLKSKDGEKLSGATVSAKDFEEVESSDDLENEGSELPF